MILIPNKGMGMLSFLVTLMIFGFLFTAIGKWSANQRQHAAVIYQQYQAIQIAENQGQRQFLDLSCESNVRQNALHLTVDCSGNQITVRYPLGEISLKTE